MTNTYSLSEIREDIKWDNPTHTRIASIKYGFQVAGKEVTQDSVYGLYPELLAKLKESQAFRQLHSSDNLDIQVSTPDMDGKIAVSLNIKHTPYSYNHIANPKQAAMDAVRGVFNARFNPGGTSL